MKLWSIPVLMVLIPLVLQAEKNAPPLPNQPENWLDKNSLSWKDLSGKVVLLNVWTFG